jgi:hypothetical protein
MFMLAKLYYGTVIFYIRLKRNAFDLLVARWDIMVDLTELGFQSGIIAETIISTYNTDGMPNAAPMGAIMQDPSHIVVNLFNSSLTFQNIKVNRCAVANLTSSIDLFYKTSFKEANPNGKLPKEWFEKSKSINAPKLHAADAVVEMSTDDLAPFGKEKTKVVFNVKLIEAKQKYPQVHCRAMSATLEAIIHATRIKAFAKDERQRLEVQNLLEMVRQCSDVVNRVAPDSSYSRVMADLLKRIDTWRNL